MQMLPEATTFAFLHAFWSVRQRIFRQIGPVLREQHDLDLPEHFLLGYVAGTDLSPTEIAEALALPAHTISRRLDALEQRGYLTRHIHPGDARKRILATTEAGRVAQEAAARTLHEELARLLSAVPPSDLETCVATLDRLGTAEDTPAQETRP